MCRTLEIDRLDQTHFVPIFADSSLATRTQGHVASPATIRLQTYHLAPRLQSVPQQERISRHLKQRMFQQRFELNAQAHIRVLSLKGMHRPNYIITLGSHTVPKSVPMQFVAVLERTISPPLVVV